VSRPSAPEIALSPPADLVGISPQREGNQFLGEGGVQDIFFGVVSTPLTRASISTQH
jgi:hypothetical protein